MGTDVSALAERAPFDFLAGGGEMGERIRAYDWGRTPLGAIESWSPALRMVVRLLLANRFPHILWWGPHYIQFYNDPYRPIPGNKHPDQALGRPASECWSEIWHIIGPLVDRPFRGGPASWDEDILLEINRQGFIEETHFTFAYSPVPDETVPSGIGGVLATVHEITAKVVGERRVLALRDLGACAGQAKTAEEACAIAARQLAPHDKDLPFVLLYLIDADGKRAHLAGAAGVEPGAEMSPHSVALDPSIRAPWPMGLALATEEMQIVAPLHERFEAAPCGPWSDPPHTAAVVPIPSTRPHDPAALMVAGVSSRLRFDEPYRDFLGLLKIQIATAIAHARSYEEEKKRAEALAQIDRAKTVFFSNVSHEFRTPLTLLLGPLEDALAIADAALPGQIAADLAVAHRNGLRLLKLVNTLLDFSRIEAGRIQANYVPTDLGALTFDLASNFRSACDKAGLRLIVDCPPAEHEALVYVDRDMWEKIVLNLLSNAFKFTLEGEIRVALESRNDHARLTVHDTGVGIPPEELPRMFERFHRIHGTRGRTHEGTGIGLALVQELVKLHGGTVAVDSEPGQGTTFTVAVPLGRGHLDPQRIGTVSALAPTGIAASLFVEEALRWLPDGGERANGEQTPGRMFGGDDRDRIPTLRPDSGPVRILWADDNADMRDYVSRLLRAAGNEIEAVADGEAALRAARASAQRAEPPDLILADVMMPKLDGLELLRELRADPDLSEIPVILLSARAGEESRIDGLQAGADDYLIKPFSARELAARVEANVRLARLRRDAKEALNESEHRFRTMANTAPAILWVTEPDGSCSFLSERWYAYTGQSEEEALGHGWLHAIHPEDREPTRRTFLEANAKREAFAQDYRLRRAADGQYRWAIDSGRPRFAPDGAFLGFVGSVIDVHERKVAELALKDADRMKDEFLAMLSHELRNPLAPIRNAVEMLRLNRSHGEVAERIVEIMERQVGHLIRLVDDLMEVTRISRGKIQLRREQVDLAAVIQSAVEISRPFIDAERHKLTVQLPSEPVMLEGDSTRLAQVVANLLNNAAKYTDEGGQIWLTARRAGSNAEVSVRDNGSGIPAEMLPKVFDLFTQADQSFDRSHGGLGIGLTLVRTLVELHGGTVEAKSDGQGLGSEFVVRLPVVAQRIGSRDTDQRQEICASVPSHKILVVDDNQDAADSFRMILEHMGARVTVVNDGPDALEALQDDRPSVVFLDVAMPGMDGYELSRRIRLRPGGRDVTLVALTGFSHEADLRRSKEAGIDHHLVKPVDLETLRTLLNSLP